MKQLVRGRTITELDRNVEQRKRSGWSRLTENKIDDSLAAYGHISWVCVMEHDGRKHNTKKGAWGYPYTS